MGGGFVSGMFYRCECRSGGLGRGVLAKLLEATHCLSRNILLCSFLLLDDCVILSLFICHSCCTTFQLPLSTFLTIRMFFVLFLLLFLHRLRSDILMGWPSSVATQWWATETSIPLKKGSGRFCPLASVVFQMALPPCFPVDGACCVYLSGCFLLLWTWCRSLY